MKLRMATSADSLRLFEWRNDPTTRAMSHNAGEIAWRDHLEWVEKALLNPLRKLYIAEEEGEGAGLVPDNYFSMSTRQIGTVRSDVDLDNACIELSWTVAPVCRGRGVGRAMVCLLADAISVPIRAEVKLGNVASERICAAAGMHLERTADGVLHFVRGAR